MNRVMSVLKMLVTKIEKLIIIIISSLIEQRRSSPNNSTIIVSYQSCIKSY